jgi:hypothetical protein
VGSDARVQEMLSALKQGKCVCECTCVSACTAECALCCVLSCARFRTATHLRRLALRGAPLGEVCVRVCVLFVSSCVYCVVCTRAFIVHTCTRVLRQAALTLIEALPSLALTQLNLRGNVRVCDRPSLTHVHTSLLAIAVRRRSLTRCPRCVQCVRACDCVCAQTNLRVLVVDDNHIDMKGMRCCVLVCVRVTCCVRTHRLHGTMRRCVQAQQAGRRAVSNARHAGTVRARARARVCVRVRVMCVTVS